MNFSSKTKPIFSSVISKPNIYFVFLMLFVTASGFSSEKLSVKLISPTSRCVFDKTDSQKAILEASGANGTSSVQIELARGKKGHRCPVQRTEISNKPYKPEGNNRIEIDFTLLETGYYHIMAKNVLGKKLGSWEITKYPYKKNSVLIRNGVPYYKGEPFLMLGLYHTSDPVIDIINTDNKKGVSSDRLTRDEMLKSVKERGFNTVHYSWYAGNKEFYQAAAEYGLMVVPESRKELGNVAKLADQPNVFSWYALDEPDKSMKLTCTTLYDVYKQTEPYHPVMTAFSSRDPAAEFGNSRMVDIAVPDPYFIKGPDSDLSKITDRVESCKKMLNYDPTTCVFIAPQLFTTTEGWNGFEPTYDQVRSQVYTAIIAGARGVFYYSYYTHEPLTEGMPKNPKRKYWFLPESNLWNSIANLNSELMSLKNAILLGKVCKGLEIKSDTKALAKALMLNDNVYLFAVNPTNEPQKDILFNCPAEWVKPAKLISDEMLEPGADGYRFSLKGYGVAVYRFDVLEKVFYMGG
ncbi:MAG: hypothetical protein JXB29_06535 [Sedimentisphaerales bacterium]|nr:hypothetical protein [Sedimentisphaerales bacterium]